MDNEKLTRWVDELYAELDKLKAQIAKGDLGDQVTVTPVAWTEGTKLATITVDGTDADIEMPEIEMSRNINEGTKIGEFHYNGAVLDLFAGIDIGSTDEVRVGSWLGEDLYAKTYVLDTDLAVPTNVWTATPIPTTGIKRIKAVECGFQFTADDETVSNAFTFFGAAMNDVSGYVTLLNPRDSTTTVNLVTLYYTKIQEPEPEPEPENNTRKRGAKK